MLISYDRQFIFFHVAKVAGLSMRSVLQPYCQEPEQFKIRRPPPQIAGQPNPLYAMWEAYMTHVKAVEARQQLGSAIFDRFYKFAFVRNPWDWQVSMYHFILKEREHLRHAQVAALPNYEAYLEWVFTTPKNPFTKGATRLQKEMVVDAENRLLVDFVGRFEQLAEDFQQISQRLQLTTTLPQINRTHHEDYRRYYTPKAYDLVAHYCRDDIELFGYSFDSFKQA